MAARHEPCFHCPPNPHSSKVFKVLVFKRRESNLENGGSMLWADWTRTVTVFDTKVQDSSWLGCHIVQYKYLISL